MTFNPVTLCPRCGITIQPDSTHICVTSCDPVMLPGERYGELLRKEKALGAIIDKFGPWPAPQRVANTVLLWFIYNRAAEVSGFPLVDGEAQAQSKGE